MERQKLYLISSHSGPRLRYVASQVFERWLGVSFIFADPSDPVPDQAIRLSYGLPDGSIRIPQSGFLERFDLQSIEFDFKQIRSVEAGADASQFQWNADIFALIFWAISRFEEYGKPKLNDTHDRFPETEMLSHRFGFQAYPFVDIWVLQLGKQIQSFGVEVNLPTFNSQATLDIDNPTAFKYKGLLRNGASILSHFLKGNWAQARLRFEVSFLGKEDPFYTFNQIDSVCHKLKIKPIHFIWIGDYGPHDKGLHFQTPAFRKIVKRIGDNYPIGLHPSYKSFDDPQQLQMEKERLEAITGQSITKSRQHYLRLRLPETYRQLIALGITDDYSMGFSNASGFRAGTSRSFLWYDLETEQETNLTIHPFAIMDSTALHHLKISPENFIQQANDLKNTLETIGGTFSVLFHNENFGGKMEWQGWNSVFETVMKNSDPVS